MQVYALVRAVLTAGALTWLMATPTVAQTALGPGQGFGDRPRIGVGYVANAPNMFVGASAYYLTDVLGGLGFYVDGKLNRETPEDEDHYIDSLTVADLGVIPLQVEDTDGHAWWTVNAALTRPVTPELMFYVGGGYTRQESFMRFRDPEGLVHPEGFYWVRDEGESGDLLNFMGGVFFRMTEHVALQFGLESAPRGLTVGGSYSFSVR